jgi:hypothetical protein
MDTPNRELEGISMDVMSEDIDESNILEDQLLKIW